MSTTQLIIAGVFTLALAAWILYRVHTEREYNHYIKPRIFDDK